MNAPTVKWIAYPKVNPGLFGGLPFGTTIEHLDATGQIVGWRPRRVIESVAAEHLADPNRYCREATAEEIAAELAEQHAAKVGHDREAELRRRLEGRPPEVSAAEFKWLKEKVEMLRDDLEALRAERATEPAHPTQHPQEGNES